MVPFLGDLCSIFVVGPNGSIEAIATVTSDHIPPLGEQPRDSVIDPTGAYPVAVALRTVQPLLGSLRPLATARGTREDTKQFNAEGTEALLPPRT